MAYGPSTNPGSAVPGMPQATNIPSLKPGGNIALTKPMPIATGGQLPSLQQDAQSRVPGIPNNGNPNGAHNNGRVPGVRNTRFGGGFIGSRPAGSAIGPGGYSYGHGALTPQQVAQNEQRTNAYQAQQTAAPQAGMGGMGGGFPQLLQRMLQQYSSGAQPQQGYPQMGQQQQAPQGDIYRGGQDPRLGRYQPPQVGPGGQWSNQGGYSYNLPNASGPYPQYGQGQYGYGNPNYNQSPVPGLPIGY